MKKEIVKNFWSCKEKIYFKRRLINLGISKKYLGFYYLTDICEMIVNGELKVRSFLNEIYPEVAKKYNVKVTSIERDIRNTINAFWDVSMKQILKPYWDSEERPSCCKFIKIVCQFMEETLI